MMLVGIFQPDAEGCLTLMVSALLSVDAPVEVSDEKWLLSASPRRAAIHRTGHCLQDPECMRQLEPSTRACTPQTTSEASGVTQHICLAARVRPEFIAPFFATRLTRSWRTTKAAARSRRRRTKSCSTRPLRISRPTSLSTRVVDRRASTVCRSAPRSPTQVLIRDWITESGRLAIDPICEWIVIPECDSYMPHSLHF
jgi:hypothetical protein